MARAKYLTEDQQAVAKKAYRLAVTEAVRYVRRHHPSVWEHALREAFLLLGVEPAVLRVIAAPCPHASVSSKSSSSCASSRDPGTDGARST
jgi:hypothetical protein